MPHSLKTYRDDAWHRFYVFDVYVDDIPMHFEEYNRVLIDYGILCVPALRVIQNPKIENIEQCLSQNTYLLSDGSGIGEGVVIKNYGFINKFGRVTWAKLVTNEFKEKHNREMGAPITKGTSYLEETIVEKYVTHSLCEKEYYKIVNREGVWSNACIPKLLHIVYNCLIQEHLYDAIHENKKPKIDFKVLEAFAFKAVKTHMSHLF